jgi:halocyanin-like protein
MDRRSLLRATPVALAATAGCVGLLGGGGESDPSLEEYLADARNFEGEVVDRTGTDRTTVTVGAGSAGLAFAPPAIEVSTGTTVRWEWTGEGGQHNVVDTDGAFESSLKGSQGATFEHTFESTGEFLYYCKPHESVGMLGGVRVV